ncbi:MAG: protoporphyrinogen oxidase, partial [Acidobacteriota bacterium]
MTNPVHIAVIGGGITGLAAAHRVHEIATAAGLSLRLSLVEATERLGGVVSTRVRDGYVLEEGPDSILGEKPWARQLADRLGLGPRIVGTCRETRRSFIVRKGRLHPTPEGFYLLAPTRFLPFATSPLLSPAGKLRAGLDLLIPRRHGGVDESVGAFVTRRLGREILDRMVQPMIAGVYGADPFRLSLHATFPRFLQMEKDHGSIIRAMLAAGRRRAAESTPSGARYGLFFSFDAGLQVLTDALVRSLPEGAVRTGTAVRGVARVQAEQGWLLRTTQGGIPCDAVIVALPARPAAHLLRGLDPELAERLASIPYGTASTVTLAYPLDSIRHRLDGFGFVVPAKERLSIVGCTFAHRKYPGRAPRGVACIRVFWGQNSEYLSRDDLLEQTLHELRGLLGGMDGAPL